SRSTTSTARSRSVATAAAPVAHSATISTCGVAISRRFNRRRAVASSSTMRIESFMALRVSGGRRRRGGIRDEWNLHVHRQTILVHEFKMLTITIEPLEPSLRIAQSNTTIERGAFTRFPHPGSGIMNLHTETCPLAARPDRQASGAREGRDAMLNRILHQGVQQH